MKKILALVMAGIMICSMSVCAFATSGGTENASEASSGEVNLSPNAQKIVDDLNKKIDDLTKSTEDLKKRNDQQSAQISALIEAVKATANSKSTPAAAPQGNGSGNNDFRNWQLVRNNAVSYGGNIIAQGGHVEINGGRSNVTFILGVPDGGTLTSANTLAANVKGSLLNCVTVSSSVGFRTARVNFYMPGVVAGDTIAVYQVQNGKWVQLPTAEIRKDHVVVDMTRYGTLAFLRVPVVATVTN